MASRPSSHRVALAAGAIGLLMAAGALIAVPGVRAGPARDFAAVDAHVRAVMEAWAVPGAAYAVIEDGAVSHLAAIGSAGRAGRAMTVQTPVVIGSVGKSITALAVRQLAEAGRIELDAPVTRYLPWFALAGPAGLAERMTIRSLLSHTSGLSTADGQDPRWYAPGRTPEDVVRDLASVEATGRAGTYDYSNLNYVVLGVVVEAVAGERYGDYLRAHVFEPLGMRRSFTALDAAAPADPAQGHRYLFGAPIAFDEPYPTAMVAAGYQVSTAEDMGRFVAVLAAGGACPGGDVVAPGAAPTTRRVVGTDWQALPAGEADAIVSQSGSTISSNADILVVPGRRIGVVVLLNANPTQVLGLPGGASDLAFDILRLAFGIGPGGGAPSVRTVYLVLDAILVALAALLAVHAIRARTWRRRIGASRHRRLLVGRTIVADLVLPAAVLLGVPLWIGSTGSSAAGDIAGGWRFVLWTLPDLGGALLALALGGLAVGGAKLVTVAVARRGIAAGR